MHFVDAGTDTGPIIDQKAVEVKPGDTLDILLGGKHFLCRVEKTPEVVRKEDADSLYTVIQG